MSGNLRILLADDSRFFRTIERQFLKKYPIEILEADSCELALALIRKDRPALVYLAYSLAQVHGADCCRAIKSDPLTSTVPVVVICDQGEPQQPETALRNGCDAYLVKPLDRHRFLQVGRRFVAGIREHRQPIFFNVAMIAGGKEYHGKSLDISGGGMFIETREDFAVGTQVGLSFSLPDPVCMPVSCDAEIAWVNCKPNPRKPQYPLGIGLRFVSLSNAVHKAILKLSESRSSG
jgi:DNA-binding NarL/FixJ family response regulator